MGTRRWMVVVVAAGLGLGLACHSDTSIGNLADGGEGVRFDGWRPTSPWAAGGTSADAARSIALDGAGNILVAGSFSGTAQFGGIVLTASHAHESFVAKLDPQKGFVWAVAAGGTPQPKAQRLAVDAAGRVTLAASFSGTASLGAATLHATGDEDLLVTRLEPDGRFVWSFAATRTTVLDEGLGLALDSQGSATVAGSFQGKATFDSVTRTAQGKDDIFVARLDASGKLLWAVSAGGAAQDNASAVALDAAGDAYVTGSYGGVATFGGTTLDAASMTCFVTKVDRSGGFLWAAPLAIDELTSCRDIAIGAGGLALTTGAACVRVITVAPLETRCSAFVAQLGSRGQLSSLFRDTPVAEEGRAGAGIALAGATSVVTGRLTGSATYGSTHLSSLGAGDIFVARIDATGRPVWATSAGGVGEDSGDAVALDAAGNIYVAGAFSRTVQLGLGQLHAEGETDVFIWKIEGGRAP